MHAVEHRRKALTAVGQSSLLRERLRKLLEKQSIREDNIVIQQIFQKISSVDVLSRIGKSTNVRQRVPRQKRK